MQCILEDEKAYPELMKAHITDEQLQEVRDAEHDQDILREEIQKFVRASLLDLFGG